MLYEFLKKFGLSFEDQTFSKPHMPFNTLLNTFIIVSCFEKTIKDKFVNR